jgi:hypothetical protein
MVSFYFLWCTLLTTLLSHGNSYNNYWHVYDPSKVSTVGKNNSPCAIYETPLSSSDLHQLVDKYSLWPNVTIQHLKHPPENNNNNHIVYGMKYALDYIWNHQHPSSCTDKKFLINGFHNGGFGSELHVIGATLGLAIDMNRIFLLNPFVHSMVSWEFENDFCLKSQNKRNLECYYYNTSSCTVYDALGPDAMKILQSATRITTNTALNKDFFISTIATELVPSLFSDQSIRSSVYDKINNQYKVFYVRNPGYLKYGIIPIQFSSLLSCSPLPSRHYYYWWRAISTMFIMRPNDAVRKWLIDHRIPLIDVESNSGHSNEFISMYVRRGDKSIEMKLAPISDYTHALSLLHKTKLISLTNHHNDSSRLLFLASEDTKVINQLKEWNEHHRKYQILITEVFDRSGLLAERSAEERKRGSHQNKPDHHPEEYLSMILNIHYLIKGSAQICTMSSNFCRIIDELRATVAGRANVPYIDLSVESCSSIPCINGNLTDIGWRK